MTPDFKTNYNVFYNDDFVDGNYGVPWQESLDALYFYHYKTVNYFDCQNIVVEFCKLQKVNKTYSTDISLYGLKGKMICYY